MNAEAITAAIIAELEQHTAGTAQFVGAHVTKSNKHTKIELRDALTNKRTIVARCPHHEATTAAAIAIEALRQGREQLQNAERATPERRGPAHDRTGPADQLAATA